MGYLAYAASCYPAVGVMESTAGMTLFYAAWFILFDFFQAIGTYVSLYVRKMHGLGSVEEAHTAAGPFELAAFNNR